MDPATTTHFQTAIQQYQRELVNLQLQRVQLPTGGEVVAETRRNIDRKITTLQHNIEWLNTMKN